MRADVGARRRRWAAGLGGAAALLAVGWAGTGFAAAKSTAPKSAAPALTAEQIVEKNVAARGGAEAWRAITSMVWVGHMESADPSVPRLTFTLDQKRPNMTRFETATLAEKSARVFDGTHGWKLRPKRDGSLDVQPYNAQELSFAREGQGLDGPLIDHAAKGIAVELAGVEQVEDHKAYRLHVRLRSGSSHDIWIDAKTFLDLKYERASYSQTGKAGTTSVVYRDYRTVEGLQIPGTLEIGGNGSSTPSARMVIDKIALNPPLDDKLFRNPNASHRRRAAIIDMTTPGADPRNAFGRDVPPGAPAASPAASPPPATSPAAPAPRP